MRNKLVKDRAKGKRAIHASWVGMHNMSLQSVLPLLLSCTVHQMAPQPLKLLLVFAGMFTDTKRDSFASGDTWLSFGGTHPHGEV